MALDQSESIFGANGRPRGGCESHAKALTGGIVETEEKGTKTSGGGPSEAGYFATGNTFEVFGLKAGRSALNHDFDAEVWTEDNATGRG